jgi:peptidoglycan/LPS O-acetylase OafA/YrhL
MAPNTFAFYMLTPARLDGLAIGSLVAILARTPTGLDRLRRWVLPVGGAAGIIAVAAAIVAPPASLVGPFGLGEVVFLTASAYIAAATFLATLTARPGALLARVVGSWPLRRIGMYSYAIYVLHDPLAHVMNRTGLVSFPTGGLGNVVGYCVVMTALSIALGAFSWHCVERPILGLGRRFQYQRRAAPGQPA